MSVVFLAQQHSLMVLECHLVHCWINRRIHKQLLILPLEESYCCLCTIRPRSGPSSWHRLDTMCPPGRHPGRCEEGHVCYYPLWLAGMYMHLFSEEVLCDRLSAFLLCCTPQEACSSIQDEEELMLAGRRYLFSVAGGGIAGSAAMVGWIL